MKKTLGLLAVATILGCADANASRTGRKVSEEKQETFDISKSKSYDQEISKILSSDSDKEEKTEDFNILESEPRDFEQEILNTLDLDNYGINQSEQERRQQRIQELIPQIKEPIILGDLTQPNVAITIDDGYGKENIEAMLDLFEKYGVKATFFVIGSCLKSNPSLWKKAAQQGHEICNHTAHHDKYFKTGNEPERFEREVLQWEDAVKMVLGEDYFVKMKRNFPFFRFPGMYGIREKAYLDILKKYGYIPIGWIYTENPKDGVVNNGDIFLWHFKGVDINNLGESLELVLKNGKQAKTVSDIITTERYTEPIGWHNLYKKRNELKNNLDNRGYNAGNKGYNVGNNDYNVYNKRYNVGNNEYNVYNKRYNVSNNGYNVYNKRYNVKKP